MRVYGGRAPWNWHSERTVGVNGMRKPSRPSKLGLARTACQIVIRSLLYNRGVFLPKRFAASPTRGAEGWKKRRSYCSFDRVIVVFVRLSGAPSMC
jgi:hypothetical protein